MGYHGDCRDCVYYSNNYNWVGKNEYYCSYSGETFADEYGNQCHCFEDIDVFKKEEAERKRKEYEKEVVFQSMMIDFTFDSNKNAEESNNQENNNESDSDAGIALFTILALILLLFIIGRSCPLLTSIISLTSIAALCNIFGPSFSGDIKSSIFKAFLFSIIIHLIYFLYNLIF